MRIGTRRDPALTLIYIFLTCGLYYLYFIYKATEETQDFLGETGTPAATPPALSVVLHIITFGIYNIFWDWQIGKRSAEMCRRVGLPPTDNAPLYLLLDLLGVGGFFGAGILAPLIQQDILNRIWDAARDLPSSSGLPPQGVWPPPPSSPRQPRPPQS